MCKIITATFCVASFALIGCNQTAENQAPKSVTNNSPTDLVFNVEGLT